MSRIQRGEEVTGVYVDLPIRLREAIRKRAFTEERSQKEVMAEAIAEHCAGFLPIVTDEDGRASVPLSALVGGGPAPEEDLVPLSVSIPRYVANALDTHSFLTGKPKRRIVMDWAREGLSEDLLKACYRAAGGGEPPDPTP